jgi:cytochrome c oxidase subunit 2
VSEREPAPGTIEGPAETDPRIEGEKHPVARMLAIGVAASVVGVAICLLIDWFPVDASGAASQIDTVYDVLLICSVPVFVLVMTIAIYSVVRFRAKPGDMRDGPPIHGNTRLEVIWVTVPFLMVTALAIYAWIVLDDIEAKQPGELVVNVTGQQFTWTFEYPSEEVKSTELVLPEDRPVDFRIRTRDVIHSFWVPEFGQKSDAVPGIETTLVITPNRKGEYSIVCTELCGLGHATMRAPVRVVDQAEYEEFLAGADDAAGGDETSGEAIFTTAGCGGCHAFEPAGTDAEVGPGLDTIDPQGAPLEEYIREAIVDPNAVVASGYQPSVMPETYESSLTDEQLDALVQYLVEGQQ